VSHMVWLHNTMSPLGATPRQYVTLVGAYARIYAAKRKEVRHGICHTHHHDTTMIYSVACTASR
jgi:hypothetical protein